jgi:hypothetical protein
MSRPDIPPGDRATPQAVVFVLIEPGPNLFNLWLQTEGHAPLGDRVQCDCPLSAELRTIGEWCGSNSARQR